MNLSTGRELLGRVGGLCAAFAICALCGLPGVVRAQSDSSSKTSPGAASSAASNPSSAADLGDDPKDTAAEIKMGDDAVADLAKEVKFDTNPADVARVNAVGARIAAIADKVRVKAGFGSSRLSKFNYTYKIIADKTVNAFSIPGGHIFIYKGLLGLLTTDDELAGVLGHETAHAAHHHVLALEHHENAMGPITAAALLAMLFGGIDGANIGQGAMYAEQAVMNNHYSENAEEDADHTGMIYMQMAGFNPVGMLAMLDTLEEQEERQPEIELGYLQDHPLTPERIAAAKNELKELHVVLDTQSLRAASGADTALVVDQVQPPAVKLMIGNQLICVLAPSRKSDAEAAADRLNDLLNNNLQVYEVKADGDDLVAKGQILLHLTPPDLAVQLQMADLSTIAKSGAEAIRLYIWHEAVTATGV